MYCPGCGSEERQLSHFCRACGTDLRVVRLSLERPDSITASAVSAREQIGRAVADKIRETDSARELQRVAEDVLPQIEKFLESPKEKQLRRIRTGVVTASVGLGATVLAFIVSAVEKDAFPFVGVALVAFFIGLGILMNGLAFTVPRKQLADRSEDALAQDALDSQSRTGPSFKRSSVAETPQNVGSGQSAAALPSVTEHTTHQLKSNRT